MSRHFGDVYELAPNEEFRLRDIGVSAFKGANVANGSLGRFLEAIRDGKIPKGSFLLVELLDRLSREKVSTALSLLGIIDSGVHIATVSDVQQLVMSIMIMSRAHEDRRNCLRH